MIYEWQTLFCHADDLDSHLNRLDIEGWALVQFHPLPVTVSTNDGERCEIYTLAVHRRPVEAEDEPEHLARHLTP